MKGWVSFIHGRMNPIKLSNTFVDAYATKNMTGVMVIVINCGCLSAMFRGTPGKLSRTLAYAYDVDIVSNHFIVDRH